MQFIFVGDSKKLKDYRILFGHTNQNSNAYVRMQ